MNQQFICKLLENVINHLCFKVNFTTEELDEYMKINVLFGHIDYEFVLNI